MKVGVIDRFEKRKKSRVFWIWIKEQWHFVAHLIEKDVIFSLFPFDITGV